MRRKEMASQRTFNLRSSPRRAVKYLLARLIRCDHCGGLFVGRRQKKRHRQDGEPYDLFRYRCNTYVTKGKEVCPSIGIHCDWIEGEVVDIVRREICSPERLAALQELVHKKIEARRSRYGVDPPRARPQAGRHRPPHPELLPGHRRRHRRQDLQGAHRAPGVRRDRGRGGG